MSPFWLLGAELGGARLHAEVRHHRLVLFVELARAVPEPVGGRRRVVGLVPCRVVPEAEQ